MLQIKHEYACLMLYNEIIIPTEQQSVALHASFTVQTCKSEIARKTCSHDVDLIFCCFSAFQCVFGLCEIGMYNVDLAIAMNRLRVPTIQ